MSDEIRSKVNPEKFGFAERRASPKREQPGKLAFDDRGNAQYEWRDDRMLEDGEDADTRRARALSVANLVLVDDEPPPDKKAVSLNQKGVRQGYNPYDSGILKKEHKKSRDLRALSKWIQMQNKPAQENAEQEQDKQD